MGKTQTQPSINKRIAQQQELSLRRSMKTLTIEQYSKHCARFIRCIRCMYPRVYSVCAWCKHKYAFDQQRCLKKNRNFSWKFPKKMSAFDSSTRQCSHEVKSFRWLLQMCVCIVQEAMNVANKKIPKQWLAFCSRCWCWRWRVLLLLQLLLLFILVLILISTRGTKSINDSCRSGVVCRLQDKC